MGAAPFFLIIFLILAVIVVIAVLLLRDQNPRKKRMMAVIQGRKGLEGGKKDDKNVQDKRRDEIAKKLKEYDKGGKDEKKKATIATQLELAGLPWKVKHYWFFSLACAVVLTLVGLVLNMAPFVILMFAVIGFMGIPRFFLSMKRKKRQKKFLEEFPDALEAMVRLLKAGMPVTEAIAMAGKEFTGPVGEEMARIYDEQKVGVSMADATLKSARRMPITEMQMFATGISIQAQTGSSLSEVLQNLANVIRARFKLKRKVQALSSEAKASAMIIGALPFLVGGGLFAINPEYGGLMVNTMIGRVLLAGSAVWMGMGIFVMKAMINFKV